MDTRNQIKSYIVREGMTMADLVEKLADQYGWSASVPNLSGKLRRDSLRYREAVELTAYLCKTYGLDPRKDGVVLCHAEGHQLGIASQHADVLHWFPKQGKSMDDFRQDVAARLREDPEPEEPEEEGGDGDVTYEQWKEFMERYRQELAQLPGSDWGQEELEKGVAQGFTDGQRPQDLATRQEVVSMIVRAEK